MTDLKKFKICNGFPNSSLLFSSISSPSLCLHSSLLHLSSHLLFLFHTDDNPVTKNSSSQLSPDSSGQLLRREGEEGESQPFSIWKILTAGCRQPLLCQCWPCKWLCHDSPELIKSAVLVTPTSYLEHQWRWETDRLITQPVSRSSYSLV